MGHTSSHTLSLPSMQARTVKLHCNKPFISHADSQGNPRKMTTLSGSMSHFSVKLHVKDTDKRQLQGPTLVNCVDANTGELIYAWLFILEVL